MPCSRRNGRAENKPFCFKPMGKSARRYFAGLPASKSCEMRHGQAGPCIARGLGNDDPTSPPWRNGARVSSIPLDQVGVRWSTVLRRRPVSESYQKQKAADIDRFASTRSAQALSRHLCAISGENLARCCRYNGMNMQPNAACSMMTIWMTIDCIGWAVGNGRRRWSEGENG